MSPRKLAEWVAAVSGTFFAVVVLLGISREIITQKTPLLDHLFGTKSPTVAVSAVLLLAAAISFTLVLLLRATSGPLEFQALGLEFRGPSGPLLLWAVCFMAVCAGAVALLKVSSNPPVTVEPTPKHELPPIGVDASSGKLPAADLVASQGTPVLFKLEGNDGTATVWLNNDLVLQRRFREGPVPRTEDLGSRLAAGENKLHVRLQNGTGSWAIRYKIDVDGDGRYEIDVDKRGSGPDHATVYNRAFTIFRQ
ncbi:MAG: hypothetical protein ACJ76Y_27505 [Thermoanaerobaculia bacterium]